MKLGLRKESLEQMLPCVSLQCAVAVRSGSKALVKTESCQARHVIGWTYRAHRVRWAQKRVQLCWYIERSWSTLLQSARVGGLLSAPADKYLSYHPIFQTLASLRSAQACSRYSSRVFCVLGFSGCEEHRYRA